jgi:hypothetical protein
MSKQFFEQPFINPSCALPHFQYALEATGRHRHLLLALRKKFSAKYVLSNALAVLWIDLLDRARATGDHPARTPPWLAG